MGVFEFENFANGTKKIALAVSNVDGTTIMRRILPCGGKARFCDKMTHISTGGGASLEFLEGIELPGIACLNDNRGTLCQEKRLLQGIGK
jgi:phosphoglycerate kinase